jgi:flagellar hook-length control protein FliK
VGPAAESSSSPLVTSTATTLLGDDVEAQLWDQVQQALGRVRASENGQELRMRLRPADLGELLIQVHTRGDHVSVRLATTNDGARQALLDDQARLAEELANAGFQGASVDVRQENDGGDRSERDEAGPVRFDRADTLPPTRRREAILRHHRRSSIELTL